MRRKSAQQQRRNHHAVPASIPTFAQDPAKHFDTLQIHAGLTPDPTTGAAALPIYASAAFQFDSAEDGAAKFALAKPGNVYGRLTNTTTDAVAARVAAIEGGTGAVAVASGHAAAEDLGPHQHRGRRRPHRRL